MLWNLPPSILIASLFALPGFLRGETGHCLIDTDGYTASSQPWATFDASQEITANNFNETLTVLSHFPPLLRREQHRVISDIVGSRLGDLASLCHRRVDKTLARKLHRIARDFQRFARGQNGRPFPPRYASLARRDVRALKLQIEKLKTTRVYLTGGIDQPVDALGQFAADFGRSLQNASHGRRIFSGIPASPADSPPRQRIPELLGWVGAPPADLSAPESGRFFVSSPSFDFPEVTSPLPFLSNYHGTYRYAISADPAFSFRTPWLTYRNRQLSSSSDSDPYTPPLLYAYNVSAGTYRPVRVLSPGTTIDLTPYFPSATP